MSERMHRIACNTYVGNPSREKIPNHFAKARDEMLSRDN